MWNLNGTDLFLGERLSAPDRWRERASGAGLGLNIGILAFRRRIGQRFGATHC